MACAAIPSTSSSAAAKDDLCQSHRELTSILLKGLRKGCVCSISTDTFRDYLVKSADLTTNPANVGALLAFLTLTRTFCRVALMATVNQEEEELPVFVCKRLHEWLLLFRRSKVYFLAFLGHIRTNHGDRHVVALAEKTFNHLLCLVPCPRGPNNVDACRRTCHKLSQSFVQLKPTYENYGISLGHAVFCSIENELNSASKTWKTSGKCSSGQVTISRPCEHYRSLKHVVAGELKQHWKTWVNRQTTDNLLPTFSTLNLWRSLVSVTSNMSSSQSRDFVTATSALVERVPQESHLLTKRKQLDILNEVLCYGSTLGIQSDVPSEVSGVAQRLLRRARSSESFSSCFVVPSTLPGMAGNSAVATEENEEMDEVPSLVILQGVTLLHLKAVALIVREAQCCSSSDESDSSLSSRGSSSLADDEREMKMIEKNVLELLGKLRLWIVDTLGLHTSASLTSGVATLFNEQDDGLVEALLCLLDTYTGLQFGSYLARTTSVDEESTSLDSFNPMDGFDSFLQAVSHDPSVILDFLLSNETCFLLYFLRMLKYLVKNTQLARMHPARPAIMEVLHKVQTSVKKLTHKQLFPYDIAPVLKLLERISAFEKTTS